jgi:hypothetical protein
VSRNTGSAPLLVQDVGIAHVKVGGSRAGQVKGTAPLRF